MKTIRIWRGCTVVNLISISDNGSISWSGPVGGAENSGKVDIELDPWAGLIVDHSTSNPPMDFREEQP